MLTFDLQEEPEEFNFPLTLKQKKPAVVEPTVAAGAAPTTAVGGGLDGASEAPSVVNGNGATVS